MIKFLTDYGIGELRGDQMATREYYIAMLEMEDHQQTMCIEKQRTIAKSVEELEAGNGSAKTQAVLLGPYHHSLDGSAPEKGHEQP